MRILDWFQTIGAGLVIAYSLIWLILHIREVTNKVQSSLKSLCIWLRRRPTMIREWRWWRKYQPSWEVISGGGIKVTPRPHGEYHISVRIPIRYISRDNRFRTRITHTSYGQLLEIKHGGANREEKPYRLFGDADPPHLALSPGQCKDTIYQFAKTVRAKPLLEKIIQCRLRRGANVYLEGIHTDRFLIYSYSSIIQYLVYYLPPKVYLPFPFYAVQFLC